jgi:hypothetical protein
MTVISRSGIWSIYLRFLEMERKPGVTFPHLKSDTFSRVENGGLIKITVYSVGNGGGKMDANEKEGINRFLAEWRGECWHERGENVGYFPIENNQLENIFLCRNCKKKMLSHEFIHPDYFTDSGWYEVWKRAKASEGWKEFLADWNSEGIGFEQINTGLIGPQFVEEWAKFMGWKGGEDV